MANQSTDLAMVRRLSEQQKQKRSSKRHMASTTNSLRARPMLANCGCHPVEAVAVSFVSHHSSVRHNAIAN